jgi:hypothetical protein
LLRAVAGSGLGGGLSWPAAWRLTLAGVVASRLLATAGAGGIALTAWALRRMGMGPRAVATRMATFFVALYAIFMAALVVAGAGLSAGWFAGPSPFALTVVPALFGAAVIAAGLALALVPPADDDDGRWRAGGRGARLAHYAAAAPAALVMSYFVGQLGNTLPLPGGIGGVEGGIVGALVAFGEPAGLALAAVLTYRGFAFWLPTLPGAVAYVKLTRARSPGGVGALDLAAPAQAASLSRPGARAAPSAARGARA